MSTETIRKPHPDAIATVYGWALPKTGEILVAKRGLLNPVTGFKPNRPFNIDVTDKTAPQEVDAPTVPEIKPEPGIPAENELPVPTTPEELDKILGAEAESKGPGRPQGVKDSTQRVQPKRGQRKTKEE